MDERVAAETVAFIRSICEETAAGEVSIIFHGGEPLLAPLGVWRVLFDEVRAQLADYTVRMSLQSNLWNLDDEFLALFRANGVALGTSLDGPRALCDTNRGAGYFERTFAAVEKARAAGQDTSVIVTVTKQTLPHVEEIARYFRNEGMSLVLHSAQVGMGEQDAAFALDAREFAAMVVGLFPWYVKNRTRMQIDTLDHFVRGAVTGNPGVCTLRDCFGMFLSISPTGDITSCQRLAGRAEFCLGNIFEHPGLAELYGSPAAVRQRERERSAAERCGGCDVYEVCKGGCYYNALASGDGVIDPLCEGYKEIYSFVRQKVLDEMQGARNIEAVARRAAEPGEHPLLREGDYISLAGSVHPARVADTARRVLALHEISRTDDVGEAAQHLFDQKICGNVAVTRTLLESMRQGLYVTHKSRNNCYIHVTFDCNLRCAHCYAEAGESTAQIALDDFERLVREAVAGGFRQVVVTGGEPLVHSERAGLLEVCERHKGRGSNLVLRTNLTGAFAADDLLALARAFNQVVVSVDGNEQIHNARRGAGSYQDMTRNLEEYARVAAQVPHAAELSLACVMGADDVSGEPGASVRALGERLRVRRVRFRPLLPLGRASQLREPVMSEGLMQHVRPEQLLKGSFRPLTTCGIGQNLFVRPSGDAYPCYAWCGRGTCLGNVFAHGLEAVLSSSQFARLIACTVDTIAQCRDCEYRYLCGGACRAWGNQDARDLNAAPPQCDHLRARAQALIEAAREYVVIG
jgi:uncharacterized protein